MDNNSIAPTSDLASLDCWDYTIELECLRGPQGIIYILYYIRFKTNISIGIFQSDVLVFK